MNQEETFRLLIWWSYITRYDNYGMSFEEYLKTLKEADNQSNTNSLLISD